MCTFVKGSAVFKSGGNTTVSDNTLRKQLLSIHHRAPFKQEVRLQRWSGTHTHTHTHTQYMISVAMAGGEPGAAMSGESVYVCVRVSVSV